MRSIAIINQKGGVGKTTTAVNLSAALARAGKNVWLVDLDPQAHASLHMGLALDENDPSIYHVLTENLPIDRARYAVDDRLWVSPAHIDLAAAEMELSGEVGREIILRENLNRELQEGYDDFDYLIIDCPPSLGVLTLNALTTVREVFLPLQPHFLALHGLSKLLYTIDLVGKRLNPGLMMTGIIYCMCDNSTRLAGEVINDVEEFLQQESTTNMPWSQARSFATRIRRNIRLAEAPSFGKSIFDYAPACHGAADYENLAMELISETASALQKLSSGRRNSTPRRSASTGSA